jgi:hypothetical protein
LGDVSAEGPRRGKGGGGLGHFLQEGMYQSESRVKPGL